MTFSILARDPDTGAIGGAAATGSLCVGGWVLKGDIHAGMSASQGASPSTLWGEDVLTAMKNRISPEVAVKTVISKDIGREFRQLAALSLNGDAAVFTGRDNTPASGSRIFEGGVVSGNVLTTETVLDAMENSFLSTDGLFSQRLLGSLEAAYSAGSDSRGLFSAALLILSPDHAPLSLRIDDSQTPLSDLKRLLTRATTGDYAEWSRQVPTLRNPVRVLD